MTSVYHVGLVLLAALMFPLATVQAAPLYRLVDLGWMPDDLSSVAFDINDHGHVVGVTDVNGNNSRAFRWTPQTGLQDLGTLPGGSSALARGINNHGQVVGSGSATGVNSHNFVWTSTEGMIGLEGLPGASQGSGSGYDINEHGHVVGLVFSTAGSRAALWTEDGLEVLPLQPGDGSSIARAINNHGVIVGSSGPSNFTRAVVWTSEGAIQELGNLPGGTWSQGFDINNHGQVTGYAGSPTGNRAYRWTSDGGMQDLGTFGGANQQSQARGINDHGHVVGNVIVTSFPNPTWEQAFLWTSETGLLNLNDLLDESGDGWTLTNAFAINNRNQIVGEAYDSDGVRRAFLVTPVPEPSTLILAALGALGLLMTLPRKRPFRSSRS